MSTVENVVAGVDGAVLTTGVAPVGGKKRKGPKPGSKRNKPARPKYAHGDSGIVGCETQGYDVSVHAKLTAQDFVDPLDFAKWEVWYFGEKVKIAEQNVRKIEASGSTPEERAANVSQQRQLSAMESLVAKMLAGSANDKATVQERLAALFAKAQSI